MAVLEIRRFPDKVLRKRAKPVEDITAVEKGLVEDMFDTMYFAKGVGLAGPQVGVLKRILICNPTGQKKDEVAIINPKIIYKRPKRIKDCEGCLSIPEMTAEVSRFSKIGVEGLDINGQKISFEAGNLLARIVQHETDHLNGVLFIDRIGFLKRRRLLAKYRKLAGVECIGKRY